MPNITPHPSCSLRSRLPNLDRHLCQYFYLYLLPYLHVYICTYIYIYMFFGFICIRIYPVKSQGGGLQRPGRTPARPPRRQTPWPEGALAWRLHWDLVVTWTCKGADIYIYMCVYTYIYIHIYIHIHEYKCNTNMYVSPYGTLCSSFNVALLSLVMMVAHISCGQHSLYEAQQLFEKDPI